jgi:NAD-dependent DNA ligase
MKIPLSDCTLDFLMACRYAYYCKAVQLVPDREYDRLEDEYEADTGAEMPVGSSQESSYTPAQRALFLYMVLSGRFLSTQEAVKEEHTKAEEDLF